MTFETTIIREKQILGRFEVLGDAEIEVAILVEYSYYSAIKGYRDKYGAPEEPDKPASIEIESVVDKESGNEISLTEKEERKIEEQIWKTLESDE